jgi:hypothetical protein
VTIPPPAVFHATLEVVFRSAMMGAGALEMAGVVSRRSGVPQGWLDMASRAGPTARTPDRGVTEALYALLSTIHGALPKSLPRTTGCTRELLVLLVQLVYNCHRIAWDTLAPESLAALMATEETGYYDE